MVKPQWVPLGVGRGTDASAHQHSLDPSQYFQDVIVSVAETPEGDKDAIMTGMMTLVYAGDNGTTRGSELAADSLLYGEGR